MFPDCGLCLQEIESPARGCSVLKRSKKNINMYCLINSNSNRDSYREYLVCIFRFVEHNRCEHAYHCQNWYAAHLKVWMKFMSEYVI